MSNIATQAGAGYRDPSANKIARQSNRAVADNLSRINPGAADFLRMEWLQTYLPIAREYGKDPGTIEQAAAHEAGHIVVSMALDGDATFIRARLHRHPGKFWGGYSEIWCPSIHLGDGKTFMPSQEPDRAGALMVIQAAGVMGEMAAGLWHPASSLEELLTVRGVCDEAGINPVSAVTAAADILRANKLTFTTLRGTLARNRRLLKEDVARACRLMVRGHVAFGDVEVAA